VGAMIRDSGMSGGLEKAFPPACANRILCYGLLSMKSILLSVLCVASLAFAGCACPKSQCPVMKKSCKNSGSCCATTGTCPVKKSQQQ